MDGLAPSPRRPDRPMVSQEAGRGSDGRRRHPGSFGRLEPADDGNLSLGRRVGVLVVLAALGGAIVLAAGGVGGNHPVAPVATATPQATSGLAGTALPQALPPTVIPEIIVPVDTLVTSRDITLRVKVPEPGTALSGLLVHVYRNSKLLGTQQVTKVGRIKVNVEALRRGSNDLTATIANDGGDGPRSEIMTITVDDQPPKVTIKTPHNNAVLNENRVTLTGRTGANLTVTGKNRTADVKVKATADPNGAYSLTLPLALGENVITVGSRDAAGNLGSTSVVIVRGDGHLAAHLKLSRDKVRLKSLPKTMDADVTVLDAKGRPVEGALVEFGITPPGQETRTQTATTGSDGTASWSRIPLTKTGATVGVGLVAVKVTTPNGATTTKTAHFRYK